MSKAPQLDFTFGLYKVNAEAGEVWKHDQKIKLQELPFKLLLALLERPGEIVTREELRQRLWGDTVVEVEDGLHTAVRKLRDALDDSATNPRFVETVPRRGYRFIAPVVRADQSAVTLPPQLSEPPKPRAVPPSRRRLWIGVGVALLAIVVIATATQIPWRAAKPPRVSETLPLTSYQGAETWPRISPDQQRIAFAWDRGGGNQGIYVQRFDGSDQVRVTAAQGFHVSPVWSPDGKQIAYLRDGSLYLNSARGGAEQRLTTTDGDTIAWHPRGNVLALAGRHAPDGPQAIVLYDISAQRSWELTHPGDSIDESPAFSPDGDRVAFARRTTTISDVYVIPTSGGEPVRITAFGSYIRSISWHPDGASLVFTAAGKLYRVPTTGSQPRQPEHIEVGRQNITNPDLFRDRQTGKVKMVYSQISPDWDIFGANLADLTKPGPYSKVAASTRRDQAPSVSPDGKRIAFASSRTGWEEVFVADRDGSNPVRLTFFNQELGAGSPRWSPDGLWIVFDATLRGNRDIYRVRSDGSRMDRLTEAPTREAQPSFSHDGRWIYFMSDRSGSQQIWKMPPEGGTPRQLTHHGGYQALESSDGDLLFYAKHKQRGIWSIPVEGGEERLVFARAPHNFWGVAGSGIYFLEPPGDEVPGLIPLSRYDVRTGQITLAGKIESCMLASVPSFAISPDGTWAAWVHLQRQADLMLVDSLD